jgi:hypothetical protein
MQMVLTREMIGPDRRLALLSWENGSGAKDLYFDGSCKGCAAPPTLTEVLQHLIQVDALPHPPEYFLCALG